MSDREPSSKQKENNRWWIAITLNVFGNFISAYGWMLQKQSHNEQANLDNNESVPDKELCSETEDANSDKQSLSYLKRWKWWVGYFTYGLGSACTATSYGFGPQSLLLPLESLSIVFNAMFGAKFLDEHLCKKDYMGIALIIFGLIISVAVGPKGVSVGYTTNDLQLLFQQTGFLVFMCIYTVVSFTDWICITMKKIELDTFYMVSFNFIAAYFGSWNILMVKCIAEILSSSFNDSNVAKQNFTHWLTYIIIIIWIVTVISLEYWRQKALAVYVSTYVMAIYRVFIIVGGVLFGALYFNDFQFSSIVQIVIFVFAVCIAMCGVFIVAMKVDQNDMLEDRKSVIVKKRNNYSYGKPIQESDDIEIERIHNSDKVTSNHETELLV